MSYRLNEGCQLNRLEKVCLFNSPCEGREITISLDPGRNILVLTGFNGVGKSRVLSAILESLSLVNGIDYSDWSEDWIIKLDFEGGYTFHGMKFDTLGTVKKKDWESSIRQLLINPKPLPEMFASMAKAIVETKMREGFASKSGDDEDQVYCAMQLNRSPEEAPEFVKSLRVVGFISDRVVFGYERSSESAVFAKKELEGDLDKTLYVLINEFISSQLVRQDLGDEIDKYIDEFLKKQGAEADTADNELMVQTRQYVMSKIKARDIFITDEKRFADHPMFVGINKIFALTSRKLVWRDKSLGVELQAGKFVKWSSLSRGEKTLLALFLIVFLNRDGALFVLDEPDLSLHMEWQKMLLPGLIDLAPNCQFIVATHSPFLVMNTDQEKVVNMARLVAQGG